jgi:2-C-methyl-D-erythritol 4-phosphate cytidylyltransferase/2-C-methyl-D-erythritol 2,4-cyclodiphosphate synthase
MQHVALLLAGGSGTRMEQPDQDKILLEIAGKTVFGHVLTAFLASSCLDGLIVVCRNESQRRTLQAIVSRERPLIPVLYTLGGATRLESVRNGLSLLPSETRYVLIHDCARPAIQPETIRSLCEHVVGTNGPVSLAHRATDTLRSFSHDPSLKAAPSKALQRDTIWAMETPQGFPRDQLEALHPLSSLDATDDLACFEQAGIPLHLIESTTPNPKLTRPADLPYLESLLRKMPASTALPSLRVGHGYDIHRLKVGLPLIIGGVCIPSEVGLEGHSDADVLSHAIADAILGALGLPDIGHFFPNTDPALKGMSSLSIIERAVAEATGKGYRLLNCDCSLIAEKPRLAPHIGKMKETLAPILGLEPDAIGIKATTQEGIGSLGQGQGIAAQAVVLLGA